MERRRKAMWLYPKVVGFNPPERWGHSACFFEGVVYVFGGCCGGLHFSDVLTLNVETMAWSSLATTGQRPGTRDSHGAALVGHRMLVFGGTNGGKKVNDLHVLDLRTGEWTRPQCKGTPPSPRESHTVTVVGGDRLVVFGGSGEGEGNYLSDVHVLDVPTMTWSSPEVKGDYAPAPRDSHGAVAVGGRLFVYGGDCGDRYHGEVDVLDVDTMAWSRFAVKGASPGVRAGHAAVSVGSKVYIIGGVGDKQYYSDVWILDVTNRSWNQLEVCGQQPQGRFSHTAVVMNTDIAIYGGCGEDERPLNELLILQLGSEHPNGRYNISMCKVLSNHWSQEKRKFLRAGNLQQKDASVSNGYAGQKPREAEIEQRNPFLRGLDNGHVKRRKTGDIRPNEAESEQEEHSLSLSQHSSPSQSDQEQNGAHKLSASPNPSISALQPFVRLNANGTLRAPGPGGISSRPLKTDQFLRTIAPQQRHEVQFLTSDHKLQPRPPGPPLIGAEVHGTIDGAFDSGYLTTAVVNGQLFRGVLFAPGPGVTGPRPTVHHQILTSSAVPPQQRPSLAHAIPVHARPVPQATGFVLPDCTRHGRQGFPAKAVKSEPERGSNDLHDVVLTLGGPGGGK
ncbi:acyl-CoA-binding domain-containing protein 4-like isoform X1 [Phragmites australis]|uniref:acyl-CoA-binding domain-containing protein 4-like isoform X1 n=2 Tax=Phragmites australis TaxID=29695 RepID=UPI002D77755F|nr:acyl-CoA-binding domain-containing protein 4-like isoform X1 [Phragmites australis]